jgi:phosphoserine phosphatase RsbU/P
MAGLTSHEDLSERLLAQIDSLQENAAPLANAANLRELATRFTDQLSTAFRPRSIELLLHRDGDAAWRVLPGMVGERPLATIPLPEAGKSVVGQIGANGSELTVVQRLSNRSHLAIRLCGPAQGDGFRRSDLLPVQLHAHLFDIGYKSLLSHTTEKGLIFSLNHRVLQLNSLIDTGIEVTKLEQEIPPHHLALQRAASLTNAAKGVVTVSSDGRGTERYLFPAAAWEELKPREGLHITTSFTYGGSEYTFELFEKESRSGVVPFDETDQLLLDALARQVQGSLENQYLHAQALEKQKIEQDIAVAASIQQRILPTTLPAIDGYDVAGINLPSRMVGGDYYDCIRLPGGRFAFVVADVAGKGINAALLVSSFYAFLSAYLEHTVPLLEVAGYLNRAVCRASTSDKFITCLLAILDPATGEIESLNAGHTPGYLLRVDGSVHELSVGGVPFGMLDMDFPFQSEKVTLNPGERLLLYTDGVTEAANEESELYDSSNPLKEFVVRRRPERADEFIRALIADVRKFTGSAVQSDDITAIYLVRRLKQI